MKTTARTILSALIATGLTAFTLVSAFTGGFNGTTTVFAFALLALYGVFEIAMISYAAPRFVRMRPAAPVPTPVKSGSNVIAMPLPRPYSERRHAA